VKYHAVLFVDRSNDVPDFSSHDALERPRLRRDDANFEAPLAERRGDFQTDEARADDDRALGRIKARDDRSTVG
jgi:hypothetical protein